MSTFPPSPDELERRLPSAGSRSERHRTFTAVALGLPTLVFVGSFLWALLRP